MSVKERLTEFIKFKGISHSAFCSSIGVSNAFISSMRKSIQPDKLERIALSYPELNTTWLMTGNGQMINNTPQVDPINALLSKISEQDAIISKLRDENSKYIDIVANLSTTVTQLSTSNSQVKKKEAI